jgi:hypothetical protein
MTGPTAFNLGDQRDRGWHERAEACAEMLAEFLPASASVADIGCGDRKLKEVFVARGARWRYTGFDLLPQSAEVLQFDVRRDRLPGAFDAAVMLGVTEYIEDIPAALRRLREECQWLVASHVLASARSPSPARLIELGWVSHLDRTGFAGAMRAGGFEARRERMTPDGRTLLIAAERMRD